jgi:hypothetical protein
MISEQRVERAVEFIRDNADRLGELLGHCKGLEQQRKVVYGQAFIGASGTVAEREARAHISPEFKTICEEIENAWAEKTTLETQLRAAELTIDVWRSQYSKQGKGHV